MGKKRYFMPVQLEHHDGLKRLRKMTRRSMTQEAQLAIEAHLQRYGLWSGQKSNGLPEVVQPPKRKGK